MSHLKEIMEFLDRVYSADLQTKMGALVFIQEHGKETVKTHCYGHGKIRWFGILEELRKAMKAGIDECES
ncbi:hypothetical protein DRO69_09835 [Candidatus Bathyarchaeota archaeon]|nr:MAG: hypothetical protein DRO69_09835 [Candidatus Bathyarchaeota archaeon]